MSMLQLKISDTNMWKMETRDKSQGNQLWPWVAAGLLLATMVSTAIFMKLPRNSKKRTEVMQAKGRKRK